MLPIVLALAQFAPQIAQWIGDSRAEQVAQKVANIAQTVTSTSTPEQALAAIQANPELAYRFQEAIVESQVELQRIAAELEKAHITANIEAAKANAADRADARQYQGHTDCNGLGAKDFSRSICNGEEAGSGLYQLHDRSGHLCQVSSAQSYRDARGDSIVVVGREQIL